MPCHYPLSDYEMDRLLALGLIKGNVHVHVHSQIGDLDQDKYKCVSVELTGYRPLDFDVVKAHFGIGTPSLEKKAAVIGAMMEHGEK